VISTYYFLRTYPGYVERLSRVSLEEFVESDSEAINLQTRLLSGDAAADRITCDHLERAKRNLKAFTLVGTLDQFHEYTFVLAHILGVAHDYHITNVTNNRPADVSGKARNIIERNNELDMELHEYAQGLFVEAWQALKPVRDRKSLPRTA
jgi:hypothetical protein